jgi:hypothetical protein
MAAIQDFLNKNGAGKSAVPKGVGDVAGRNVSSAYGGVAGKIFLASDVAAIATSDNKLKSIFKTAKDIALFKIIWPAALVQGLIGVQNVFRHLVIDSGSLAAAIERIKTISVYQGQFEPLLKGVAQAKMRVAELMAFASKSPFDLDSVVKASRSLEIFTRGAMGSGQSLKLVSNIAKASGTSIEQAADAFGGLYRALQNKEPISRAGTEIQRMGLLSDQTSEKIQRLQNTGATFAQVWLTVQEAIKTNSKQTDDYSKSVEGLTKQLDEQQSKNKAAFGKAFVAPEVKGIQLSLSTAKNLQPVMETLGGTIAEVTTTTQNFSKWIVNLISSIPGLSTAVGAAAKSFVLLGEAVGLLAAFKGGASLIEWIGGLGKSYAALNKTAVATKLLTTSTTFLDKAATASANGQKAWATAYGLIGNITGKASTAVGGLTLSLRGLAIAAATNPITWIAAAIAATAVLWQLNEATNAAAKSLGDLSQANSELLSTSADNIRALETEDDAYTALAKTTEDVIAARKKLKALGPAEEAGVIEKAGSKGALGAIGFMIAGGMKDRRELRNAERDSQEQEANLLDRRTKAIKDRLAGGALAPNKEKQAVLEEAAARKVRLDQMERENRIQLATGHEKLRLMQAEQAIEAGKGEEGEAAATARAELAARTQEILANKELKAREMRRQMTEAAKASPSPIIREEQRVAEMAPGKEKSEAELAIAIKRKDIELDRTAHDERAKSLALAVEEAKLQQSLADIRLTAEEKIAELKSVGVERAKEEYAIKMATLDATLKAQITAGRPEEARATRAAMQVARQDQLERTRGVEVTRAQFQIELQAHAARREGRTKESEHLQDVNSFLSHFEDLRGQFGKPEAQKMALEKRRDELLEQQNAGVGAVVVSSLQRIGGGGGVYGVNATSIQRVQERIRDLTASSQRILEHIDANTKEGAESGKQQVEIPAAETVTAAATGAQHAKMGQELSAALAEREAKEPRSTGPTTGPVTSATAKIVVPGAAPTIPPGISITKPAGGPGPRSIPPSGEVYAAPAAPVAAPAAVPTPLPGPLSPTARIVVPGEAPAIPPSVAITNPPVGATPAAPVATPHAAATSEAEKTVGLETVDIGGKALDYIRLISENIRVQSAAVKSGKSGGAAGAAAAASQTPEERQAMINRAHGIYGIPKFGMFPHKETLEPEGPAAPALPRPGTGGRAPFAMPNKTLEDILGAVSAPSGSEPGVGTGKETLPSILGSVTEPGAGQRAPYAPSPSALQAALAPPEEEAFAAGPNFHTMQILRTLKNIHESHMESNGHLDLIASKESGVQ